jgi:hypothetical protein
VFFFSPESEFADGDEWNWSGAFRITEAGTVTLRMRSLEEGRPHIMARIQARAALSSPFNSINRIALVSEMHVYDVM